MISIIKIICSSVLQSLITLIKSDLKYVRRKNILNSLCYFIRSTYEPGSGFRFQWCHDIITEIFSNCFEQINEIVQKTDEVLADFYFVHTIFDMNIYILETVSIEKLILKSFVQKSLDILSFTANIALNPKKYLDVCKNFIITKLSI